MNESKSERLLIRAIGMLEGAAYVVSNSTALPDILEEIADMIREAIGLDKKQ